MGVSSETNHNEKMKNNTQFMLYNTMSKQKELFTTKEEGKVGMYVCGVTVYDYSHIGHARAYVAFDVLYRYLQHLGYDVTYVRNFTDIDDKIIDRANKLGEDPLALSRRFCQEFHNDMNDLQCLPPTHEPLVSDHIDQIKNMIDKIIENGCAYAVEGGDVFFSVAEFPDYYRLSGRKPEDNQDGKRVGVNTSKRNPADFALWKAAKPGEPSWDSKWGPGRPGWHIECSAMSEHYLGFSFDIHGGGIDLVFPHHENELAQSSCACSESESCNIRYWMHNGFVNDKNRNKMAKSKGNFFTIREVTKRYHPLALRYFLMSTHYRSDVSYSIEQLEIASESVFYLYQTLHDCEEALSPFQEEISQGAAPSSKVKITSKAQECIKDLQNDFKTRMSDDLHTPCIMNKSLQDILKFINSSLDELKKTKQQQRSLFQSLYELEKEVKVVLNVLGLMSSSTYSEVLEQLKEKALTRAGLTEEDVTQHIAQRTQARKNKEYSKSDQIREDLKAKGIHLMDWGNQTIWRPCVRPITENPPAQPSHEENHS